VPIIVGVLLDYTTSLLTLTVVASIEETAERYDIPEAFIGLILIPIVVSTFYATTFSFADSIQRPTR